MKNYFYIAFAIAALFMPSNAFATDTFVTTGLTDGDRTFYCAHQTSPSSSDVCFLGFTTGASPTLNIDARTTLASENIHDLIYDRETIANVTAGLATKAATSHTHTTAQITGLSTAIGVAILVQKGAANGLATLDSLSTVPLAQVPTLPISKISTLSTTLAGLQPLIAPQSHLSTVPPDIANDAPTNADTSSPTNLSAASVAILGINVPTNSSYVALVAAHNNLAVSVNHANDNLNIAAAKYNASADRLNEAITTLDAVLLQLQIQGLQSQ